MSAITKNVAAMAQLLKKRFPPSPNTSLLIHLSPPIPSKLGSNVHFVKMNHQTGCHSLKFRMAIEMSTSLAPACVPRNRVSQHILKYISILILTAVTLDCSYVHLCLWCFNAAKGVWVIHKTHLLKYSFKGQDFIISEFASD